MSSQRVVRDSFWTDSYVEELDPSEKLMFLYLLTNPLCNIAGIYEIRPKRIAYETGFDKEMVERLLNRFVLDDKILRTGDWIVLINHAKHQSYNNPNVRKGIQRIINDLPPEVKALKGFERLSHFTLLNLTIPTVSEQSSGSDLPAKKEDMGWNKYAEDYEEGEVDLETGELHDPIAEKKAKDKEANEKFRVAIDWLIKHQGRDPKRTPIPKQLKAIQKLYTMGVSATEAKQIIIECEGSDIWKGKLEKPDFWTVVSIIQKRG